MRKIDFQDGGHGGHLGFPIGTILATVDLQITLILRTKIRINWLFGSGEEEKNRFSRLPPFLIAKILLIVDLQVTPMLPTKFRVNWPFVSGEEAKNRFSRRRCSWISDRNDFRFVFFLSTSHPMLPTQVRVS